MHCKILVITEHNSLFEVTELVNLYTVGRVDPDKFHVLIIEDYEFGGRFMPDPFGYTVKVSDIDIFGEPYAVITPAGIIGTKYYDGQQLITNDRFDSIFEHFKRCYIGYYVTLVDAHCE